MYLLLIRHVLLVVCMLATASVYGQGNPTGESWLPKQGPAEPPEFQRLAFVKTSADQQGLTILMPSYESTTKVRQVSKTVFENEIRVRTVKSNGQDQTQEYTVVVPRVITETQEYIGAHPDGRSTKHGVPLSKLSAWTMTGQEVSREELAKRFVTPARAFVMEAIQTNRSQVLMRIMRVYTVQTR